jgi:hypothetical protein
MIDHGGGDSNGRGSGGLNRFAQTGPTMIYGLLQQLQSLGLNLPEVLKQLGVPTDTVQGRIATDVGTTTPDAVTPPKTTK